LLDEIKEIAQRVVDSNTFLQLGTGRVRSVSPLTVELTSNGLVLPNVMLMVGASLSESDRFQNLEGGEQLLLLGPACGGKFAVLDVML
jgi:hypothetical protein